MTYTLSDDESSAANSFEKLKQELFKCFPKPCIKGLRGASSKHVSYMSQLAAEVYSYSFAAWFLYLHIFSHFCNRPIISLSFLFQLFARSMITEDLGRKTSSSSGKLPRQQNWLRLHWPSRKCYTVSPGRPGKSDRPKWRPWIKLTYSSWQSFWTRGLLWSALIKTRETQPFWRRRSFEEKTVIFEAKTTPWQKRLSHYLLRRPGKPWTRWLTLLNPGLWRPLRCWPRRMISQDSSIG